MDVETFAFICYRIMIPTLCMIGIAGNILNLVVLRNRSWKTIPRLERFTHLGIMFLAVSDMCVCVAVLPMGFVFDHIDDVYESFWDFKLLYSVHSSCVINTFVLYSTLLTVAMSVVRYIAIKFPIHAKSMIGSRITRWVIGCCFVVSVICNIPRVFTQGVLCVNDSSVTNNRSQTLACRYDYYGENVMIKPYDKRIYFIVYFIVAFAIPFLILIFCNCFIIIHLSKRVSCFGRQKRCDEVTTWNCNYHTSHSNALSKTMNIMLIVIVIQYLLCVIPAQTIAVCQIFIIERNERIFTIIFAIVNTLEVSNFSLNFLLYLIVNGRFRKIFHQMACFWKKNNSRGIDAITSSSRLSNSSVSCNLYTNNKIDIKLRPLSEKSNLLLMNIATLPEK